MLYLSGVVKPELPSLVTPRMRQRPTRGMPWAADTGCYSDPASYSTDNYLAWLLKLSAEGYRDACLFATAPDVVGDWRATLERSLPVLPLIRELGYPAALVAQDGLETSGELNDDLWDELDALFIGGTTAWKLGEGARELIAAALERGKHVHVGRVNSRRRYATFAAAGVHSCDGTVLRFDPTRDVQSWAQVLAQQGLGL